MKKTIPAYAIALTVAASTVFAASQITPGPYDGAIKARQSHMRLNAFNIGVLAGMAKGKIEYNAEAAANAASNLNALANLHGGNYWPEGSDSVANKNTNALPKIWQNFPDFASKAKALKVATAQMDMVAGNGLDALKGQIKAVGGACGGCHKEYRQSE